MCLHIGFDMPALAAENFMFVKHQVVIASSSQQNVGQKPLKEVLQDDFVKFGRVLFGFHVGVS